LAMAKSDPKSGSGARGPCLGMRGPPSSSGDPAALKVETSAVRSVGSIALGLPFPILAAMARGAGRDCLALGPTARRQHAPPTKVSAHQARGSAENRSGDSRDDQPYGARQCALGRTTGPRRIADVWFSTFPRRQYHAISEDAFGQGLRSGEAFFEPSFSPTACIRQSTRERRSPNGAWLDLARPRRMT
jgi:hypothetical protein